MDSERDLAESREPDTDRVSTDEHEIVVIGAGPAGLTPPTCWAKEG